MNIDAKIIADSISPTGVRLTTFQLKYQRLFHSEVMTHRMLSRNASSSRAIPVQKMISQVWNNPAAPVHWGQNKPGMQAKESLTGWRLYFAKSLWAWSGRLMCAFAYGMMKIGLHKQVANRILEPWQYIHVVVTATDWDNFFKLRNHKDAQPEFQQLAALMWLKYIGNIPNKLAVGEWHLPYIDSQEIMKYTTGELLKMSAARCARVSYVKHDGLNSSYEEDVKLYSRLIDSDPPHMSPVEHQATPTKNKAYSGNFRGWKQFRKIIEVEKNNE